MKSSVLVLQSHAPHPPDWVVMCLESVARWAAYRGFTYRCVGDELFEVLPAAYAAQVAGRGPILADLARLLHLQTALEAGYERACWFDADVLLWAPEALNLEFEDACFGRERWVEPDARGRFRVRSHLHNAFCAFARGSVTLPFLARTSRRIIERADAARIAPQMVGPKLISALGNIVGFESCDAVGALSPSVMADIAQGGGPALARLRQAGAPAAGANLCASLTVPVERTAVCEALLAQGCN